MTDRTRSRDRDDVGLPDPPWRSPRRPLRRRITREGIVDAAAVVLDRDGADAVTARAVAEQMGTGPASLYAHVDGKNELLELLVDRVIGEMAVPEEASAERWTDQLRQMCHDTRTVLLAHPGIAKVALAGPPSGPNALRRTESLLGVLRTGGLSDQVAGLAVDLLSLFVVSSAYEADVRRSAVAASETDWPAKLEGYFAALPPHYPNIIDLAAELTRPSEVERFEFGLDVLIGGIRALGHSADG
ncbi:MAG: TetR/AcrR family transcriptional regulator [Intrasporangium sp.]|uniref:TetR/AcrR family transcriptional regulator n=1 Tax=Intrasporangium sp. TaxID=1925024 RepID=UPI002648E24D|nr:TetR/AcrR family transcriptional regulator [Intrasporangium sp.]MDN5795632.1 TetR/AcrR family transcriptional regulator [Intrasporangium sp.]